MGLAGGESHYFDASVLAYSSKHCESDSHFYHRRRVRRARSRTNPVGKPRPGKRQRQQRTAKELLISLRVVVKNSRAGMPRPG